MAKYFDANVMSSDLKAMLKSCVYEKQTNGYSAREFDEIKFKKLMASYVLGRRAEDDLSKVPELTYKLDGRIYGKKNLY